MKKQLLTLLFLSAIIPAFAQTYATPELKEQEEKHRAEKMEWIKNNPEAYRAQCINIGENLKDLSDVGLEGNPAEGGEGPVSEIKMNGSGNKYNEPPSPERKEILTIDKKDTSLYKLVSVRIVDINNKYTQEEKNYLELEAENWYYNESILIDWNKNLWYSIPRDSHSSPTTSIINRESSSLESINCIGCQPVKFNITEQTPSKLIFLIEMEEEDFSYQLEF